MPILDAVQTPDPLPASPVPPPEPFERAELAPRPGGGFWEIGDRLTWLSGLVLAISAFTNWYSGPDGSGPPVSVTGWNTGALGKLVFFVGLAVLALHALREAGIELPATVPEGLVVIALGSLATIFVLIRLISIPDDLVDVTRGIGIYISLLAALGVIVAGLLRAGEEL
jgi:hypothetical protein